MVHGKNDRNPHGPFMVKICKHRGFPFRFSLTTPMNMACYGLQFRQLLFPTLNPARRRSVLGGHQPCCWGQCHPGSNPQVLRLQPRQDLWFWGFCWWFFLLKLQQPKKLDDGWPESVEEQGLPLLVWRRNFRNDIWKMCYRQSRRGVSRPNSEKCKTKVCIANTFTHIQFLHTKAFTQKLLHTEAFTHSRFYTDAFTHRRFYTQRLLHTEAFTHRRFYIQTLLHRHFYTQTRLHTDTFTHRPFYTQELLLHTNACTHRSFYT